MSEPCLQLGAVVGNPLLVMVVEHLSGVAVSLHSSDSRSLVRARTLSIQSEPVPGDTTACFKLDRADSQGTQDLLNSGFGGLGF